MILRHPVKVEVVRPELSVAEAFGMLIGSVLTALVKAWLLMLVVPFVTGYDELSFWHAVAIVFIVVPILNGDSRDYLWWTQSAGRWKRKSKSAAAS